MMDKYDLISRVAALDALFGCFNVMESKGIDMTVARTIVKGVLDGISAVDAAPVVRCKKCVHWLRDTLRQNSNDVAWWNEAVCDRHSYDGLEIIKKWTSADFYCADGERRDDDADD